MRNHVLNVTGRIARPLNDFEIKPLICDLMRNHGGKTEIKKLKQAYEAAWAQASTRAQASLLLRPTPLLMISWRLRFHRAMLIGEVIPLFYEYLRLNPAARERVEFSHILVTVSRSE